MKYFPQNDTKVRNIPVSAEMFVHVGNTMGLRPVLLHSNRISQIDSAVPVLIECIFSL